MWPDEKLKIARRCGAKDHSWMDRCRKTSMWRAPPTYPSNYALDTNFEFITLGLHWDILCGTQHCTLTTAMSPLLRWISAHPRALSLWMGRVRRVSFHATTAPCSDGHQNRRWHAIESSQQRIALAWEHPRFISPNQLSDICAITLGYPVRVQNGSSISQWWEKCDVVLAAFFATLLLPNASH